MSPKVFKLEYSLYSVIYGNENRFFNIRPLFDENMTSVMVKRVLKRQKLESRQLDKLAEIYNFLDENGDGCLTPNELSNSIRKYIHKNVEDDDDETKTMDVVDEIGKKSGLSESPSLIKRSVLKDTITL